MPSVFSRLAGLGCSSLRAGHDIEFWVVIEGEVHFVMEISYELTRTRLSYDSFLSFLWLSEEFNGYSEDCSDLKSKENNGVLANSESLLYSLHLNVFHSEFVKKNYTDCSNRTLTVYYILFTFHLQLYGILTNFEKNYTDGWQYAVWKLSLVF